MKVTYSTVNPLNFILFLSEEINTRRLGLVKLFHARKTIINRELEPSPDQNGRTNETKKVYKNLWKKLINQINFVGKK